MKKRLLAAIMSLCMIVSLLPVSALAYEGEEEPAVQSRDGGYPADFYVVKPDVSNDEFYMGIDTDDFVSVGEGRVGGGIPDPNDDSIRGGKFAISYSNWTYTPPADTNQYPSVTYAGEKYFYWDEEDVESRPENYYTITWYRYSNAYDSPSRYVWHVDGYVSLNDWPSVAYRVQFPNENDFDWVDSSGKVQNDASYSYVKRETTFIELETTPSMSDQGEYTFDGWYTDQRCTKKVSNSDQITVDTIFYGRYVKKGPDITVTKELATVNGVDVSDKENVVLYDGDQVNWTIKITNNTDESIVAKITDTAKYTSKQGAFSEEVPLTNSLTYTTNTDSISFNSDSVNISAKETKEISLIVPFEVDSGDYQDYEDGTLTNTATVTYNGKTYTDSTENPIGHILTVTYKGNGGTQANGAETVTETVRAPSLPYAYEVKTGNLGFQKEGYTFVGWYKDLTCEDPVEKTEELHSGAATYFAKWTEDKEPVDPDTDIFFFISLPSNDKAMSGEEEDYRYLTHGGVIDKDAAGIEDIDATGITSLDDESEITKFVETWPAGTHVSLGDDSNVGFDVASPSVGSDSWWTIDASGKVSEFSITITNEKNEKHTYTSADYGIRWAKISYATTAVDESENINASKRYHVDGVLYSKETVDDVLTDENFQKTVDSDTLSYNNDGTLKSEETFSFVLDMLTGKDGQPSNAFEDIELTATVTDTEKNAKICLPENSMDGSTSLTPGYYVIQETLEGDQANAWNAPDPIYFELTSNGNVVVTDGKNTITNTLETYTLTYNLGGAPGTPPASVSYKYNENVTVAAAPVWSGHTFQGWSDGTNTYQPGDPIRITKDTTLTAVWDTLPRYTLTYNANGGTLTDASNSSITVTQGEEVQLNNSATRDGYIFMGWTTETILGQTYGVGASLPETIFQRGDSFIPTGTTTLYAVWGEDRNHDDVADVYEVFIAPADITIYTGGTGYEGVSDGAGNEIENSNSGLPEPGFHIILPADLGLGDGNVLDNVVRFQYKGLDTITDTQVDREWTLSYVGIYSDTPRQYVYSLESALGTPAIRVTYTDPVSGAVLEDADIGMTEDAAHGTYTISINHGGLTPTAIQAEITKLDGSKVTRSLVIGTGELTIRSTVDDDTTPIAGNEDEVSGGSFTAVDNGASYKVNDSEVDVPTTGDRVHLLVDEVSDSPDFNNAMGEAALDHAHMPNASYETAYLDLVDSQTGNTVVTLDNGSMDIYWPMPSNADPSGTFQVVHYYNMNRETTVDETALDTQASEVLTGTPVYRNGDWYVRFTTHSFSPFVLVYEEDTSRPVNPNPGGGSGGDSDSDPTGNLSIELDVNGGDDEFTFTVILTDKDGDDLENNFYYNGDYTGTIGSGDEITLEGGDKIVIRNLPEGTRYEVIIETADGYTYVIDGEEGVIHTGMNEAEFTATRTVPVADPSVTGVSRWLNTTDHISYLTGYPGGAFGPDNNMTRAEVAQMFYALLNNKNVTITKTFPDVPADAWYATAVNTLASLGMVSGDENGNYRPNDPITRAEFCVIALAFAYEPENAVCYFGDVSRSDWFYTYVAQAASYGWIGGYTNGNFGPNDRITRAQVTTIVNNMLGRAADRDYVIDHQADLVQFTDLTRAHWGYFQIMEATNAHDYTKSNGTENWR